MARVPTLKVGAVRLDPLDPSFRTSAGLDRSSFGGAVADATLTKAQSIKAAVRAKLQEGQAAEDAGKAEAAGLEGLGGGLTSLSSDMTKIALDRQIQDNEREAGQAYVTLAEKTNAIKSEYNKLSGQAALDAKDKTQEDILKARTEVIDSSSNPHVRGMITKNAGVKTQAELFELERKDGLNRKKANDDTSLAIIGAAVNTAAANTEAVPASRAAIIAQVDTMAENNGWTGKLKPVHDLQMNEHLNSLHTGVIDTMVSKRDYAKGVDYMSRVMAVEEKSGSAEFTASGRAAAQNKLNRAIGQQVTLLSRGTSALKASLDFGIHPKSAVQNQVRELKKLAPVSSAAQKQLEALQESIEDYPRVKEFGEMTPPDQTKVIERWKQHQDIPLDDARRLMKYERKFTGAAGKYVRGLADEANQASIAIKASEGSITNLTDNFGGLMQSLKVMAGAGDTTSQLILKGLRRDLEDAGMLKKWDAVSGKQRVLDAEGIRTGAAARTLPARAAGANAETAAAKAEVTAQVTLAAPRTAQIVTALETGTEDPDMLTHMAELQKWAETGNVQAVKQLEKIAFSKRAKDFAQGLRFDKMNLRPLAQRILERLEINKKASVAPEELAGLKIHKATFDKEVKDAMSGLAEEVKETIKILEGSPTDGVSGKIPKHLDRVRGTLQNMISLSVDGAEKLALELDEGTKTFILGHDVDDMTIDQQGRIIRNVNAQGTLEPYEFRQLKRRIQSRQRLIKGIEAGNGLQIAEEKQIIPPLPDYDPNSRDYWMTVSASATKVEKQWGVPVLPVNKERLEDISNVIMGKAIDGVPTSVVDSTTMLNALKSGLTEPQLDMVAQEVVSKHPEFAVVLSESDDSVNREILSGVRILNTPGNKLGVPTVKLQRTMSNEMGNTFMSENSDPYIPYQRAAVAIYVSRRQGQGDDELFHEATLKAAIHQATGGILKSSGQSFLAPVRDFSQDDWDSMWTGMTQDQFLQYGNGYPVAPGTASPSDVGTDNLSPVKIEEIRSRAQFVSVGQGRYFLQLQGQKDKFVHTSKGVPFEMNMEGFVKSGDYVKYKGVLGTVVEKFNETFSLEAQ